MVSRTRRTGWIAFAGIVLVSTTGHGDLPPRTTDGCVMLMRMCRAHCGPTWIERGSPECRERCLALADKCMARVPDAPPAGSPPALTP